MFQGIVFDLDDTLYDQQLPFAEAIRSLFSDFPEDKLNQLFIRFRYYSDLHYMKSISGEWSLEKLRYERIKSALADFDYFPADAAMEKFQQAYDYALQRISVPTEIADLLDYLKRQKIPLGLITNGPVDRQQDKINALQLEKWFETDKMIISDAVQIQKPEPAIFHLMEDRLELAAELLLYVGDSFDNDMVGAKKAGWSGWWFNHQKRAVPTGQAAIFDKEITSFEELNTSLKAQPLFLS